MGPVITYNISSSLGILFVMLPTARLSTHIQYGTSFLGVSKAGTPQGLKLSQRKPLDNNSSTCLLSFACSLGLIRYDDKLGNDELGTKSMACCILRTGGISLRNFSGTRSEKETRTSFSEFGISSFCTSITSCFNKANLMLSLLSRLNCAWTARQELLKAAPSSVSQWGNLLHR